MTVKIVVDVLLWALAAKTLYRPVNLLWPWTSNLESITSKSWDSPVKTSKLSSSWSRRLSSYFKHIYQIATFRSLGPLYDKTPFYPKKLSPRLKLTGTAHWDWIHQIPGTFLILTSSPLMIERCPYRTPLPCSIIHNVSHKLAIPVQSPRYDFVNLKRLFY